ncbi:MAG: PqqD family protein [Acidimicrobiales bacterium]
MSRDHSPIGDDPTNEPNEPNDAVHRLDPTASEWRLVDDEVIALDLRTSGYIALNATGAVLWQALADGATTNSLVTALTDAFTVDAATAAADVDTFLAEMGDVDTFLAEMGERTLLLSD